MVILAKSSLVDQYDLRSWHNIWCAAAPLDKALESMVRNRIGVKIIRQGYGMTESSFACCRQSDTHHTEGAIGVLLRGIHGRVVDIEHGGILGPNQTGELQFKGKNIMKGYIGNAEATRDTIDSQGWLHTGDVGYYNENDEWFITGRIKELIKYNAYQVPPAEIEAVLLTHPQIQDAGVVGVPHEKYGEVAIGFVVKQPKAQITENDVIEFIAGKRKHFNFIC